MRKFFDLITFNLQVKIQNINLITICFVRYWIQKPKMFKMVFTLWYNKLDPLRSL